MTFVDNPKDIGGVKVVQTEEEVLEALVKGETVARFEWGDSMKPILSNGEYAILTPIEKFLRDGGKIERGDAVFCEMTTDDGQKYYMTHMVWEISKSHKGDELWYKIGSSNSSVYGWTNKILAFAKGTEVIQRMTRKERKWFNFGRH